MKIKQTSVLFEALIRQQLGTTIFGSKQLLGDDP